MGQEGRNPLLGTYIRSQPNQVCTINTWHGDSIANLTWHGDTIANTNNKQLTETDQCIKLHPSYWINRISSIALATLKTNKFNEPRILPVKEGFVLLKSYPYALKTN